MDFKLAINLLLAHKKLPPQQNSIEDVEEVIHLYEQIDLSLMAQEMKSFEEYIQNCEIQLNEGVEAAALS